jgi:hypothetical protein
VEVADTLRRLGFAFDDDPLEVDRSAPAAFALAETLTGVRLTPGLLAQASFVCGTCPPPPAPRV